jgi:hypothetical protein
MNKKGFFLTEIAISKTDQAVEEEEQYGHKDAFLWKDVKGPSLLGDCDLAHIILLFILCCILHTGTCV